MDSSSDTSAHTKHSHSKNKDARQKRSQSNASINQPKPTSSKLVSSLVSPRSRDRIVGYDGLTDHKSASMSGDESANPFEDEELIELSGEHNRLMHNYPRSEPIPVSILGTSPPMGHRNGMERRPSIGGMRGRVPEEIARRPAATSEHTIAVTRSRSNSIVNGIFTPALPSVVVASALTLQNLEESKKFVDDIMTTVPDLTTNTDEKQFTLRNIYFNLKKDIFRAIAELRETVETTNGRIVQTNDQHMRSIRQNQIQTQYLITDVSRHGAYTISKNAVVELKAPKTDDHYRSAKNKTCCFSFF